MTVRLVIFGRQGAGKGTQCVNIVNTYGVAHISTGDMLRAAVAAGTEMGMRAKEVMDAGGLVGDDIINGIVADRILEPDAAGPGFVLDGYPRTQPQAEALLAALGEDGLDAVINLDVPLDEVTARMKSRGREDDTDEAIERRLSLYEQETRPVLDFFDEQGLLVTVDGLGTEEEVSSRLISAINEHL
ncbi:MAG: adenylate kinase [Acidimicrobiales bacterium]